ncbi:MAG: Fic family protein [Thermoleophilaceae bacterium]
MPTEIADRDWNLDSATAEALGEAERRCRELEAHAGAVGLDTVARQLLRSEAVASSKIEGLVLSHRRLAKASAVPASDVNAQSVLGNVAAIEAAYDFARSDGTFSLEGLRRIHARLFQGTPDERLGGVIRQLQNWIGGDATSPLNADFVPPPEGDVERLLADLAAFCDRTDMPAVLQAAIAHAQYETIHPFMDGNGRAGRALIGMVLIRRRVSDHVLPPVSLVLAGNTDAYVQGLTSYRYGDERDWFDLFAGVTARAADVSELLAKRVVELQGQWLEGAGRPRAGSAPRKLIDALPTHPVLTLRTTKVITGLSDEACRRALNRLETAGVLNETTAGKRNRVWESVGLFELLDQVEREAGDLRRSPAPTR